MRQDFEFFLPRDVAQKRANRKTKKAILTGAMVTAFLFKAWVTGFALLGIVAIANIFHRKDRS